MHYSASVSPSFNFYVDSIVGILIKYLTVTQQRSQVSQQLRPKVVFAQL